MKRRRLRLDDLPVLTSQRECRHTNEAGAPKPTADRMGVELVDYFGDIP